MKTSMASKAGVVLLAVILGACATKTGVVEDSGFLRDYSNLRETKDAQGRTIRAWVSPKLTPANYDAILLDPLCLLPRAEAHRAGERRDAAANSRLLERRT